MNAVPPKPPTSPHPPGERVVLVVDDSSVQRAHLVGLLQSMNYGTVLQAIDGVDALHVIEERGGDQIDLIITDIDMPSMDGFELISHLAEQPHLINLIATSARDPRLLETVEALREEGSRVRLLGTLTKPVTQNALARLLENAEVRARSGNGDNSLADSITLADIEAGLKARQFVPYVQPKISMSTGLLTGVESLARWVHPQHGLLAPNYFIPKTEGSPLMPDFTLCIVEQSLDLLMGWAAALPTLSMSINLSADDLADQRFVDRLVDMVRQRNIAPRRVIWEVTETMIMRSTAMSNLARLGLKGFGLSMDDYGVGYSSMQTLSRSPFTELKIDRIFVDNASERANRRAILVSSLDMGKRLGISTVAEGVERVEDWRLLRTLACDTAQGFLIARPMPADELVSWTRGNRTRLKDLAQD
ncbi:MAG TPA: EAL domain-containing response regulator [Burkholderiaceae bacterium]|jgi:EAL domain-containing protein (putative c-di-GMP-specific phosphodiesterase class I)